MKETWTSNCKTLRYSRCSKCQPLARTHKPSTPLVNCTSAASVQQSMRRRAVASARRRLERAAGRHAHAALPSFGNIKYASDRKLINKVIAKIKGCSFWGHSVVYLRYALVAGIYRKKGVNPYVVFLDNNVIKNRVGSWYIGLRQLTPAEYDVYSGTNPPGPPAAFTGRLTSNYTLVTYTSGCYYCQPTDDRWSSSGCTVCNVLISHSWWRCCWWWRWWWWWWWCSVDVYTL